MRFAIVLGTLLLASTSVFANCAEDLSRVQSAIPNATSDVQASLRDLVNQAVERAKAQDSAGCESATALGLQLLGLPNLQPVELSTPLATSQPSPVQPAAKPSDKPTNPPSSSVPTSKASISAQGTGDRPVLASGPAADATAHSETSKAFYFSTRDLVGTSVKEAQNQNRILGALVGFVVDSETATVTYALINQGGLFGLDARHVAVPFSQMRFFGQWDAPAIDVSAERLALAPPVSDVQLQVQMNDPRWRKAVAEFWGPSAPPRASTTQAQVATARVSQASATSATAATTQLPPPSASVGSGNPTHGKSIVRSVCAGCHTDTPNGGVRVGPDLYGVFGRPVASSQGYNYSRGLAGHKGAWDAAALDAFIKNPRSDVPGTYMTFPGLSSDGDRQDVIAYLKTLSAGAAK